MKYDITTICNLTGRSTAQLLGTEYQSLKVKCLIEKYAILVGEIQGEFAKGVPDPDQTLRRFHDLIKLHAAVDNTQRHMVNMLGEKILVMLTQDEDQKLMLGTSLSADEIELVHRHRKLQLLSEL